MEKTLRLKIIGCILIGIFVVLVGSIFLSRRVVFEVFNNEMLKRSHTVADFSTNDMVNLILTNDIPKIKLKLYRIKQENTDIEYIFLADIHDNIIASTINDDIALKIRKVNPVANNQEVSVKNFYNDKKEFYDIAHKVLESNIGELHIGFSKKNIRDAIDNFNANIIIFISSIGLLGIILAGYVAKLIIDPIEDLSDKMHEVRQGNLDVQINIRQNDEVGLLGQTFNIMINDLKKAREQIEHDKKVLEKRVYERTKELSRAIEQLKTSQEQLIQSAKLAAIGQLVAGISHELNNPMTGIIGYSQFILEKVKRKNGYENFTPEELKNVFIYIGHIEKESMRCKKIISDLLKFARVSKKDFMMTDINKVIEETLVITEQQLAISKIALIKKLSTDLPEIFGNAHQLQQVFVNIIVNAIQAMKNNGSGSLAIKSQLINDAKLKDLSFIEISLADTGCGISEENINKIFEPFFTTKDTGDGTGLGLSISYNIIKNHGGHIKIESKLGEGSVFKVILPVKITYTHEDVDI
ncbi:HAMP domain-containing protein [Candidatus Poribacteria bacterium]|nr:HAMP domain-containing protein [Candidatus Poribacteria bacterium]